MFTSILNHFRKKKKKKDAHIEVRCGDRNRIFVAGQVIKHASEEGPEVCKDRVDMVTEHGALNRLAQTVKDIRENLNKIKTHISGQNSKGGSQVQNQDLGVQIKLAGFSRDFL